MLKRETVLHLMTSVQTLSGQRSLISLTLKGHLWRHLAEAFDWWLDLSICGVGWGGGCQVDGTAMTGVCVEGHEV